MTPEPDTPEETVPAVPQAGKGAGPDPDPDTDDVIVPIEPAGAESPRRPDPAPQPIRVEEFSVEERTPIRIDRYLAMRFPDYSRSFLRRLVDSGHVTVNDHSVRGSYDVQAGDRVRVVFAPDRSEPKPPPQKMDLDVLYEDDDILLVNKPAGLSVHPAPGQTRNTLVNALVHRFGSGLSVVAGMGRPGIVHRLDKDTTGVILVAKTDSAHFKLGKQFEGREVQKEYLAIVYGVPVPESGYVTLHIGKHRNHADRMTIDPVHGKEASTFYAVQERFEGFALVRCHPRTGRTHQIRLHLASIGHAILADAIYARKKTVLLSELARGQLLYGNVEDRVILDRQALHAHQLTFTHPTSGERVTFRAELPPDMKAAIDVLRRVRENRR